MNAKHIKTFSSYIFQLQTILLDAMEVAKIFKMSTTGANVFTYRVELDPCKVRTGLRILTVYMS